MALILHRLHPEGVFWWVPHGLVEGFVRHLRHRLLHYVAKGVGVWVYLGLRLHRAPQILPKLSAALLAQKVGWIPRWSYAGGRQTCAVIFIFCEINEHM